MEIQNINCNSNMNKKQVRLTESDLKQIVKESVNKILSEAYGTPSTEDNKAYDNLTYGSITGEPQDKYDKIATKISKIYGGLDAVMRETWSQSNPYSKKIHDLVSKAHKIADFWKKQEIMKLGQQPDLMYNLRHEKPDYSYLHDPDYIQSKERAFGA